MTDIRLDQEEVIQLIEQCYCPTYHRDCSGHIPSAKELLERGAKTRAYNQVVDDVIKHVRLCFEIMA